jgi:hypothetical protein
MKTYDFDLAITRDMTGDDAADLLFELFEGDVSPVVRSGVPFLSCSIEAPSFFAAVRRVLRRLRAEGVEVLRVELEPDAVAA